MAFDVLVVEEDIAVANNLVESLKATGLSSTNVASIPEAAESFANHRQGVVVLSLLFSDEAAIALMRGILGARPNTRFIVSTAPGSMKHVAEAMEGGAFDYIVKPYDQRRIVSMASNAKTRFEESKKPLTEKSCGIQDVIFEDQQNKIRWIAQSTASVLITGEKGTGKQLCARCLHRYSGGHDELFEVIKTKNLVISDFSDFFSEKIKESGGTLYLDDICDLPLATQTELLRFLQSSQLSNVSDHAKTGSIRVVCATSGSLAAAVTQHRFREDLFYRLNAVRVDLPAFRTLGPFKVKIAEHLLVHKSTKASKRFKSIGTTAKEAIAKYTWPGNADEMIGVISAVVENHDGKVLEPDLFPAFFVERLAQEFADTNPDHKDEKKGQALIDGTQEYKTGLRAVVESGLLLAEMERHLIEEMIVLCGGSIPKAAAKLRVSPSTIYRKKETWIG